jgi:TIR domain
MSDIWAGAQSSDARRRVFISYSHDPPENAAFVRDLAGRLSSAGFDVWLDEEKLPGAANIQRELEKAIGESEVGLFVVTSRWVKREWTQFEVELFGQREDSRRLVVLREDVDLRQLGPYLIRLKNVRWPEGDEERDARFWEVYCGIVNRPPGPRELWAQEGRRVAASHTNPVADAPAPPPSEGPPLRPGGRIPLPCTGRPVASLVGDDWTFLVTDHEEWVGVAPDGKLNPASARLSDHAAAAFGPNQELLVGMYEPMLARLRGERWDYLTQEAPVLCFAATRVGSVAGTAAGGLVLVDDSRPSPFSRVPDPVAALAPFDGGLVVLGSRGWLGRVLLPGAGGDGPTWISAEGLGRPVGFFEADESDRLGVYSATRLGILDPQTGRLSVCAQAVPQGIRAVVFLGARSHPYAVLTDAGGLLQADAALRKLRPVRLPREAYVTGCCPAGRSNRLYAWTHDGELYTITEQAVESTASGDVVLAYRPNLSDGGLHVVRWRPDTGASLEWLAAN